MEDRNAWEILERAGDDVVVFADTAYAGVGVTTGNDRITEYHIYSTNLFIVLSRWGHAVGAACFDV